MPPQQIYRKNQVPPGMNARLYFGMAFSDSKAEIITLRGNMRPITLR
jgi:hypothetical protein